jgi:hypothetical protein
VTPHQSLANHLLDAHARGRPLKKLIYVWALRDPKMGLVSTMVDGGQFPTNRTLELAERTVKNVGDGAEDCNVNPFLAAPSSVLHTTVYCTYGVTDVPAAYVPDKPLISVAPKYHGMDPLHAQADLEQSMPVGADLKYGRPDFPLLFARVKELAAAQGERRVAVSVCGPASMVESATMACRAATSKEIPFDLHIEVFRL